MSFGTSIGAGDLTEIAACLAIARSAELRRIGYVCSLSTKLQLEALGKGEVLEDGEIKGPRGWTDVAL